MNEYNAEFSTCKLSVDCQQQEIVNKWQHAASCFLSCLRDKHNAAFCHIMPLHNQLFQQTSTDILFIQCISAESQLLQTFQPLNSAHFLLSEFYWEIASTISRGRGNYLAGKTFSLLCPCDGSMIVAEIMRLLSLKPIFCYSRFQRRSVGRVCGISHHFSSAELEMMSAACIPVVGIIKKGWLSFQGFFLSFFLFFYQLLLTLLAFSGNQPGFEI